MSEDAVQEPDIEDADADESDTDDAPEESPDDGSEAGSSTASEMRGGDADEEADADESVEAKVRERIAEADPGDVAAEIVALREHAADLELRVEELESERDDLEERLKRTQADFQNYKKRQKKRREEERERATEDLVTRLLEVRDNLHRAVQTDEDADIRDGVEATLRQLDDVLEAESVERFEPEPGDDVDPQRHEVLLRVESDQPEGTVAEVHRPGYEMAGKVLRTAQVTVSE